MSPEVLTVEEASAAYQAAMRNVLPAGSGICSICHTFIDPTYTKCYKCLQANFTDVVVPITYSEHLGQMHTALRNYKDSPVPAQNYAMPRLAGVLWRFIASHELCVAQKTGVEAFDLVTTVPSSMPQSDDQRSNFRTMIGWCDPIKDRYQRVLMASGHGSMERIFDAGRYSVTERLDGMRVLLLDDTWTTGAHAQSAAYTLKNAGATHVGVVVIGRHIRPEWDVGQEKCSDRLAALPRAFDWGSCAVH